MKLKQGEKMEKKEYEKPVLIEHENLNEVTKGENGSADFE